MWGARLRMHTLCMASGKCADRRGRNESAELPLSAAAQAELGAQHARQAHPATAVSTVEHQLWQATSNSSALLAQLQTAGVPARRVLLISSEPLDPAALPPGSRYRLLAGMPRP